MKLLKTILTAVIVSAALLQLVSWQSGLAAARQVHVLKVDGPIVPVVAQYLDRGISQAELAGAPCVVELNTPGGLYETTQKVVTRIMNARVPVVVYVSPAGGWAASAGTFITLASHVAAMAPGTRIGAAHPVAAGVGTELPPVESQKVTEDAAAWARSIALTRGRDLARAELAVRESKSYSDLEALDGRLIDLRATDFRELLEQLDGRKTTVSGGTEVVLCTASSEVVRNEMSWIEELLLTISNPNLAYVLLIVGFLGILLELFSPGAILPGVLGGVSMLLGLYAMGTLNAYWGGLLLLLLAFVLFIAEAFIVSHGLLSAGGIASLVLGSMMLFSQGASFPRISTGLIAGVAVILSAFLAFIISAVVRGQKGRVVTGREALVGKVGRVLTPLNPEGMILVEGERWHARSEDGELDPGRRVAITGIEGLMLLVREVSEQR